MRHYQNWESVEQKAKAWLELCDLSAELMLAGVRLTVISDSLVEKEFWSRLNYIRQKNRLVTQQAMALSSLF